MPPGPKPSADACAMGSAEPPSTVSGSPGPLENAQTNASDRADERATSCRNDLEDRRRQQGLDGSFRCRLRGRRRQRASLRTCASRGVQRPPRRGRARFHIALRGGRSWTRRRRYRDVSPRWGALPDAARRRARPYSEALSCDLSTPRTLVAAAVLPSGVASFHPVAADRDGRDSTGTTSGRGGSRAHSTRLLRPQAEQERVDHGDARRYRHRARGLARRGATAGADVRGRYHAPEPRSRATPRGIRAALDRAYRRMDDRFRRGGSRPGARALDHRSTLSCARLRPFCKAQAPRGVEDVGGEPPDSCPVEED